MSENQSSKMEQSASCTVPIYRVALIREATVIESPCATVRKSSEAAELLRPLFTDLDREHFVHARRSAPPDRGERGLDR